MTPFARADLIAAPTPLHALPNLTRALGGPALYVKREDLSGIGGGGNKLRKLEYVLPLAKAEGADTIVTIGATESNHVRATAAAAARLGLRCVGLLVDEAGARPGADAGNRFLSRLFGARLVHLPGGTDYASALAAAAAEVREAGHRPFVVPAGGSTAHGCLGGRDLALELAEQASALRLTPTRIVLATGTGGTLAGLAAGLLGAAPGPTLVGYSVGADRERQRAKIAARLAELATLLPGTSEAALDSVVVDDGQVGPGYGRPSSEACAAIAAVARLEGLLLDPIYTGKAMAGLIAEIRAGRLGASETVIFIHTGGAPSLPAYIDHLDTEQETAP